VATGPWRRGGHPRPEFPVVIRELRASGNGEMYVSTAYPNHVFAFDPGNPGRDSLATPAETGSHGLFGRMLLVHRGPACWPGDRQRDPSYFRTSYRWARHRRSSTNGSMRCRKINVEEASPSVAEADVGDPLEFADHVISSIGGRSGRRFSNPLRQSFALTEMSSSPGNRVKAATMIRPSRGEGHRQTAERVASVLPLLIAAR
jgi:hypothetical protein